MPKGVGYPKGMSASAKNRKMGAKRKAKTGAKVRRKQRARK